MPAQPSLALRLKNLIIGNARSPHDHTIFHKLSLIAFFAWVGLGADGLSSSAYGPEEAFLALDGHNHLAIFIAIASALTIFVISASYSQIIELFPIGGEVAKQEANKSKPSRSNRMFSNTFSREGIYGTTGERPGHCRDDGHRFCNVSA